MFPYFEQPSLALGPLTIHAFGVMVALAVIFGEYIATRRVKALGLDTRVSDGLIWWAIIIGFIISHLYVVFFYYPGRLLNEPLYLFKIWDGISSLGGIVGGLFAIWLYFRLKQPQMPWGTRMRYLDAVTFAFPFAWIFGRLGCTLAHDHPGVVTHFPLSVSLANEQAQAYITHMYAEMGRLSELPPVTELATMGFFDLGLLEFLYTLLVIAPIFVIVGRRKDHPPGFFLALFIMVYTPVRFMLDFLRLVDATYLGLTPAQWIMIPLFGLALFLMVYVMPRLSQPDDKATKKPVAAKR